MIEVKRWMKPKLAKKIFRSWVSKWPGAFEVALLSLKVLKALMA
jgi:hypothetical protein